METSQETEKPRGFERGRRLRYEVIEDIEGRAWPGVSGVQVDRYRVGDRPRPESLIERTVYKQFSSTGGLVLRYRDCQRVDRPVWFTVQDMVR